MTNKSWFPSWGDRSRDADYFRGFKTQIDSLFEDWFGRSMGGLIAPRVDMAEDAHSVTLTAELPGVAEGDVDVTLDGDQLTIRGEKRSEHEDKKERESFRLHRLERAYGTFQRTVTLPYRIDPDQVTAQFSSGVLKITLPKPTDTLAARQGRKIAVNRPPAPPEAGAPNLPQ
jgi:HSP20 family protein